MTYDRMNHVFMRAIVWNMRWMTRHMGFIARPIVRLYGDNEIIACGLRNEDNTVAVIYTPKMGHRDHVVLRREGTQWVPEPFHPMDSFSGAVVSRLSVTGAQDGLRYKMVGWTEHGRRLTSPTITVKPATIYDPTLLETESVTRHSVHFSWGRAEEYDPMIYFLVVEDESSVKNYAAIYTRETFWSYPKTKTASYSVGPAEPLPLDPGKRYVAQLVLVDFDGWVSHLAKRVFSVPE